MASRMRSARRRLRKELLQCIDAGKGDIATLGQTACAIMGHEVGIEEVTNYFYANEVSNAMKKLRVDGEVESVGRLWMRVGSLSEENVETISIRRLKRLRGESKAQLRLAHDHGRIDEAVAIGQLLEILNQELVKREVVEGVEVLP